MVHVLSLIRAPSREACRRKSSDAGDRNPLARRAQLLNGNVDMSKSFAYLRASGMLADLKVDANHVKHLARGFFALVAAGEPFANLPIMDSRRIAGVLKALEL